MSTQKNEHNPETTAQGPSQKLGPSAPLELQERGELVQRRKMCAQLQAEIDKLKRECAEQRSAASYNLSMQEAANKERDEAFKLLDEIRRITPLADTTGSGREGETPETDKATITSGNWPQFEAVRADFARQLERQRDAALAQLEALRRDGERLTWLIKQGPPGAAEGMGLNEEVWDVAIQNADPNDEKSSTDQHAVRAAIDSAQRQEGR